MANFIVFMSDLPKAPLQNNQTPLNNNKIEQFGDIDLASKLADNEKNKWELVSVYEREINGQLKQIRQYLNGRKNI